MKLQKHPISMLCLLCFSSMIEVFAQDYSGYKDDIKTILKNAKYFSNAYVNGDYEALANSYTMDGNILPPGADIIAGREAIKKRWKAKLTKLSRPLIRQRRKEMLRT